MLSIRSNICKSLCYLQNNVEMKLIKIDKMLQFIEELNVETQT